MATWATLFVVVVGGLGRYFLVDAPSAESQKARTVDELVESLRPNLHVTRLVDLGWNGNGAEVRYRITNAGSRAIQVKPVKTNVWWFGFSNPERATDALPKREQVSISECEMGLMTIGETLDCVLYIDLGPEKKNVGSIKLNVKFEAETSLRRDSQTWKVIRAAYDQKYIDDHVSKYVSRGSVLYR